MSTFRIASLVVVFCLSLIADRCYACGSTPIACISNCPKFDPLKYFENGGNMTFSAEAGSYDPDNGPPYGWGNGIVD